MAIKTVRVRIAVAVNARGELGVSIAGDGHDQDASECALDMLDLLGGEPTLECVHFVEADVPLPTPPVIEFVAGTVVECA